MPQPIEDLTPRQIVAALDQYIIGQAAAKRAVAVALRNRFRRQQLPIHQRDDVLPKNILMMGPTGVGKTEIARRLAQLARAPFVKVEATKFTEVGYVGRDVESMVRDLAAAALRLVEREWMDENRPEAEKRAGERLVDFVEELHPAPPKKSSHAPVADTGEFSSAFGSFEEESSETREERKARRAKLAEEISAGQHDHELIEVYTEENVSPFLQVFTPQGMEEMGLESSGMGMGTRTISRRITVKEAKTYLVEEEAKRMIDQNALRREALIRAAQTGIIFIDEIDKVAGKSGGSGPDVSREGVQRDLLPVIEGSTVQTKFGPLETDHILFIAAGAFHISKPSDLIPELQGRLPIRVELEPLSQGDFARILKEPRNSLVRQYQLLLGADGVKLEFSDDAVTEIADIAAAMNEKGQNIGARRLHTVMERLLEDILFDAPDKGTKHLVVDVIFVKDRLESLLTQSASGHAIL
ncbi:MAG: ATP-dependent protease ATPase subunit HslU [Armatimonadetes bacterium]|nr:ATP-dependent protease ATPase subunit HslU [Armatimonadota bacterium]